MIKNEKKEICPIRDIIARLSDKWSLLVIITISRHEKIRFNQIQREIGDISQRMLTITLRSLEADGIVNRRAYAEIPPRVEYNLTPMGYSLLSPLKVLVEWAKINTLAINNSRKIFTEK